MGLSSQAAGVLMHSLNVDSHCLGLAIPKAWEIYAPGADDLLLAAWGPKDAHERPCVVSVTHERLSLELSLGQWQQGAERIMAATLIGYQVLDLHLQPGGVWQAYRLARYAAAPGDPVTMEQWMLVIGQSGLTLSVVGASIEYAKWRATSTALAESVTVR